MTLLQTTRFFALTSVAAFVVGCGGGSSSSTPTASVKTATTYQGAGSDWALKANSDGTCVVTESTSGLNINATCVALSSGFTEITVTSVSGGSAAIPQPLVGAKTYAYQVAGYMMPFISFPENGLRKVVPTVVAGNCSTTLSHNFIVSFAQTTSAANSDFSGWGAYGTYATTNGTSLNMTLYKSDGSTLLNNATQPFDMVTGCDSGKLVSTNASTQESTRFYLTQNGGAIFYQDRSTSTNSDTVGSIENDFMLPVENNITAISDLNGTYGGFVITGNGRTSFTNEPVTVTMSSGTLNVASLATNTLSTANATHSSLIFGAKKSNGLYPAALSHGGSTTNVGCAVTLNGGSKKIMICGGLDPADATNKTMYSVILASQ